MTFLVDQDTSLRDFYYFYKENEKLPAKEVKNINEKLEIISDADFNVWKDKYFYELKFTNKGGLIMPLIIQWNYSDGTSETERISAYIWRKNEKEVVKTFAKNKEVKSIILDPFRETADIDEKNNTWNIMPALGRYDVFKEKKTGRGQSTGSNPMQKNKNK
jgi:hypothetical protein